MRYACPIAVVLILATLSAPAGADELPPVTPPGPDETLIYVMREGRMVGAIGGHWIAINDETVGYLSNDTHTIFRYPAGMITLNIATGEAEKPPLLEHTASGGMPIASIALDDRGGETVYLEWKVNTWEFIELDEKAARKLIRKTDRSKPIDEFFPNIMQMGVLMNLSRLGFDLMEPAAGPLEPDAEHGVVTIFRQKDGDKFDFGIWHDNGFVGTLGAREAVSLRLSPGSYFFMASHFGFTHMMAEVEAGKRYYAWVDHGGLLGRLRLTPVPNTDARNLEKLLRKVSYVQLGRGVDAERVRDREKLVTEFIRETKSQAREGGVGFDLLAAEHAFP